MKIYLSKKITYKTIIENFYNKAWPGKVEILYFLFTVCWNPFRALKTSNIVFPLQKSNIIQLHFKRLGNQQETKDIGAFYLNKKH